jgi:hypothetical protein
MFCFVGGVKAENLCLFQALCFASWIHRFDAWTSHLLDLLFILHGLETTMFTESRSYTPIGSGRWWTIYIGVRGRVVWDFCTSNSSTVSGAEVKALLEGEMIFTLRVHNNCTKFHFSSVLF